jgi:hypothetical protein
MGSNADLAAAYRIPFDISGFYCMSQVAYRGYVDNWNTFNRIQLYNLEVSTLRAQGQVSSPPPLYYQFANFTERSQFQNGRMLHIRRYPNSNWAPVPET